ncbi:PhzF family phenazine biosynthesis protein [Paenibacillus endoradicis]|uniref:PhzF family phenazine biosynthesis protein n=1 Tax=Paenibacillus endoradicis TaxID=2972487 RepID=UPI0021598A3E|nr:PhzF family phenazine biosynthesis protein [Paenibacillus endoradicis]MCR8655882.1 PhzF family phenazine biosynthesis protein [Paenibacillus endoradicis]MCR8658208.1 PhzF family phenazine biosynthesis protein [Paenibacillus endoradicis]
MSIPYAMINAYGDGPFTGNPAAVLVIEQDQLRDPQLQQIAAEMNVSETAFIYRGATNNQFQLRWFTPQVEVNLCGHATLASAHYLYHFGIVPTDITIHFHTLSGELVVSLHDGVLRMRLPQESPVACSAPSDLITALGVIPRAVSKNRMDYIVELADEQDVRQLQVEFSLIAGLDARGVVVTSRADDPSIDIVCRTFYPRIGIDEDPVTGSAFCALAPYWMKRLRNNTILKVVQLSIRGGSATLMLEDEIVIQEGSCFVWAEGSLHI